MAKNTKLELTWIGKEKRPRLEPRVLIEDPSKSYHAAVRRGPNDIFDNLLIHGDNLLALKALEQEYTGKVKCIYIDPPYNTGSAFEHYDDGLEHSIWLNLMRERIVILKRLLRKDGTIWVTLDDNETHYFKVMCDEVFNRKNFIADVIWNSRKSVSSDAIISLNTNHILVYAADIEIVREKSRKKKMFKLELDESKFSNPDNDPRGKWTVAPFDAPGIRANESYPITNPKTGQEFLPAPGRHWSTTYDKFQELLRDGRITFGKKGVTKPQIKRFWSECADSGSTTTTLWDDVDTTTNATQHSQKMFKHSFTNPKPENLIKRVLQLSTEKGDLVLDSFLGSGTTAAVAHKMGRRWIGIELGDQAYEYCKPRLDLVINGEEPGGISKECAWIGGGGYRFYELAPTLIKEDTFGQKIINPQYDPEKLAEAVCKLEGFTYAPSETEYFIHGHSTERDFIYVTTNYLMAEHLRALSELIGDRRTLLICCKGFTTQGNLPNLTVKKIPKAVLDRCEYGHDDYSLNVKNLPMAETEPEQGELFE